MFGLIVECYKEDKKKLHATYETTIFTKALDREIIRALGMILRLKIEINMEADMVRMAYSII